MMSRLALKIVRSPFGNCLIITDTETGKNIEIMSLQLQGIAKTERNTGSLPHGGWDKDGDEITVYHDDDRDNHEVTFTIAELNQLA